MSRRHTALRWHPDNAVAHCFSCHQRLGENPVLFHEWIVDKFGKERIDFLRQAIQSPVKLSKADKEQIHQTLKSEAAKQQARRALDIMSRLEFESPLPSHLLRC